MLVDVDAQEVHRLPGLVIDARRGLPRAPADVVQRRRQHDRLARLEAGPRLRELARDERVVDLHDDLGGVADGMDDHRMMYPPSTTSAVPIVELDSGAAR